MLSLLPSPQATRPYDAPPSAPKHGLLRLDPPMIQAQLPKQPSCHRLEKVGLEVPDGEVHDVHVVPDVLSAIPMQTKNLNKN